MESLPELFESKENNDRKREPNNRNSLLCQLLLDFAKNTTLHGLRYVTERGITVVEKIFWIITFVLSISMCGILIRNVWVKWQTTPVIVTFSEQLTYVSEVPFPSVTVCPQAKIDQRMYNYTDNMTFFHKNKYTWQELLKDGINDSAMESFLTKLSYVKLVCRLSTDSERKIFFTKILADHAVVETILKIAPKWEGVFSHPNSFSPVLTKEGLCFTFNSLAAEEILNTESIQRNYSYLEASRRRNGWSIENGYSSSSTDVYPRREQASGPGPNFWLILAEPEIRDKLCDGNQPGFKVYLHHPGDLPQSSLYYYTTTPGIKHNFAISVNAIKSSSSLSNCPVHTRQCYFPYEKKLRFFKVYSANNCRLECLTNYTLAICGCVWFHMPYNDSTMICGHEDIQKCAVAAVSYFHNLELNGNNSTCECLPSCTSVDYTAKVLRTSCDSEFTNCAQTMINQSTIIMFFKEPFFVSKSRECSGMFDLTDFLAYCGGLLGLFLGFSFLSIIEIFYFCTLRLFCVFSRGKKEKKNENSEIIVTIHK